MKRNLFFSLIVFLAVPAVGQDKTEEEWTGTLADGTEITREGLDEILREHEMWYESDGQKGTRADLSNARLAEVNFEGASLDEINLSGAYLFKANLSKSISLSAPDLSKAELTAANLSGVILYGLDLSGANLFKANLSGAEIRGANLSGATLVDANLSGADLFEVNLSEAIMSGANLDGAFFEPISLPHGRHIHTAKGLETVRFNDASALVRLRDEFRQSGYRDRERLATYLIKRSDQQRKGVIERTILWALFDLTCQYGYNPWRCLHVLGGLILVFACAYFFALKTNGQASIWKVWPEDRIDKDIGDEPERLTPKHRYTRVWFAFFFSLLSAFNIGWRDLNVGNWLMRVQKNEYALRATGWIKSVSGVQSLISVYLLALWALTYFGRPFE